MKYLVIGFTATALVEEVWTKKLLMHRGFFRFSKAQGFYVLRGWHDLNWLWDPRRIRSILERKRASLLKIRLFSKRDLVGRGIDRSLIELSCFWDGWRLQSLWQLHARPNQRWKCLSPLCLCCVWLKISNCTSLAIGPEVGRWEHLTAAVDIELANILCNLVRLRHVSPWHYSNLVIEGLGTLLQMGHDILGPRRHGHVFCTDSEISIFMSML